MAPGTGRLGTTVELTVHPSSTRSVEDAFEACADVDAPTLQRSRVSVRLVDFGGEFLSRSEARRRSLQLDQLVEVVLDFDGVDSVGQALVDELFRESALRAPGTTLVPST